MSKWVNSNKFEEFKNKKREEKDSNDSSQVGGFFLKWNNPKMGTQEKEKVYRGRLLPDKNGDFYFKYFYHFIQIGDQTYYIKCPKSDSMNNFCPWCHANQQLWKGNDSDKKRAYKYKRNTRFVVNFFIGHDPRDADAEDENRKVSGKVRLYEFPETIESKIKNELTNDEEGYGYKIFDPEEGHDLMIKIKAKKPDKNGKVWPDYSNTEFSRKPSAIAETTEEVEKIMESVYDLTEYLKSLEKDWKFHEKLLKQELVWDDVEDAFIANVGKESVDPVDSGNSTTTESTKESGEDTTDNESTQSDDQEKSSDDDVSDDDLLAELDNL